jgi:hypothetical protein
MSIPHRLLATTIAIAAAAAPGHARATTYAKVMDVDQLIEHAERVVRGTVASTEGRWTSGGYIETVVTVQVDEVYVGQAGETVTVIAPGGTVEGKTLDITGAPRFTVGERVLVFADGRKIVGFGQGAFQVDADNVARRGPQNAVPHHPLELDLNRAFGQPDRAQDCIEQHMDASHSGGWKLRGATGTRLGREDVSMWRLSLVADMEYRLDACGDGTFGNSHLVITDEQGVEITRAEAGEESSLTFIPAESGVYFVGLYADDLPDGVWRGAASVSIHYR